MLTIDEIKHVILAQQKYFQHHRNTVKGWSFLTKPCVNTEGQKAMLHIGCGLADEMGWGGGGGVGGGGGERGGSRKKEVKEWSSRI